MKANKILLLVMTLCLVSAKVTGTSFQVKGTPTQTYNETVADLTVRLEMAKTVLNSLDTASFYCCDNVSKYTLNLFFEIAETHEGVVPPFIEKHIVGYLKENFDEVVPQTFEGSNMVMYSLSGFKKLNLAYIHSCIQDCEGALETIKKLLQYYDDAVNNGDETTAAQLDSRYP